MRKKLKLLCSDKRYFSNESHKFLKKFLNVDYKDLSQSELDREIYKYDFLLIRFMNNLTKKIINKSKLKAVISVTTGLDHIDLEALKNKNIKIFNLKNKTFLKNVRASIEHTIFLIVLLSRINFFNQKNYTLFPTKEMIGTELFNKKIGIVGYGRIGKEISKILHAFGAKIYFYDKHISTSKPKKVTRLKSVTSIFQHCDIISINVTLKDNENLINERHFKKAKKNVKLINTSRGQVVNTNSLLSFLKKNKNACAALDVIDHKHKDKYLNYKKNNNNLVITPHIGGLTKESIAKTDLYLAKKFMKWYNRNYD
jgi:D-3-phosphoglycerate dehydrogenase / 2-oxoglutarate reductase